MFHSVIAHELKTISSEHGARSRWLNQGLGWAGGLYLREWEEGVRLQSYVEIAYRVFERMCVCVRIVCMCVWCVLPDTTLITLLLGLRKELINTFGDNFYRI